MHEKKEFMAVDSIKEQYVLPECNIRLGYNSSNREYSNLLWLRLKGRILVLK